MRSLILIAAGVLLCLAAFHERRRAVGLLFPLRFRTIADIPYGQAEDQRLDILQPRWSSTGKRPAAVVFHGGAWRFGKREDMRLEFCRFYLEQGFVAVNVEYRRGAMLPAMEDARSALEWVFANARTYGIDPDQVVVTGASAGAHLAMWAAFRSPRRPAAVVNFYGVSDVTAMLPIPSIRGVLPAEDTENAARDASPIHYVHAGMPPVLSIHGTADDVSPVDQTHRLTEAIRRAGGEAEEEIVEGARHGFSPQAHPGAGTALVRFLRQHGIPRALPL